MNAPVILLHAIMYAFLLAHPYGFALCSSKKKSPSEKSQMKTARLVTIRQNETLQSVSASKTSSTGTNEAKTQATQWPDEPEVKPAADVKKSESVKSTPEEAPKKKKKDKLDKPLTFDKTLNSIRQSKRLPRAPKGHHDEELDQMEQILAEEASNMQQL